MLIVAQPCFLHTGCSPSCRIHRKTQTSMSRVIVVTCDVLRIQFYLYSFPTPLHTLQSQNTYNDFGLAAWRLDGLLWDLRRYAASSFAISSSMPPVVWRLHVLFFGSCATSSLISDLNISEFCQQLASVTTCTDVSSELLVTYLLRDSYTRNTASVPADSAFPLLNNYSLRSTINLAGISSSMGSVSIIWGSNNPRVQ